MSFSAFSFKMSPTNLMSENCHFFDTFWLILTLFDYFHGVWLGVLGSPVSTVLSVVRSGPNWSKLAKTLKRPYQSPWKSSKWPKTTKNTVFTDFHGFSGFVRKFISHGVWFGFWKLNVENLTEKCRFWHTEKCRFWHISNIYDISDISTVLAESPLFHGQNGPKRNPTFFSPKMTGKWPKCLENVQNDWKSGQMEDPDPYHRVPQGSAPCTSTTTTRVPPLLTACPAACSLSGSMVSQGQDGFTRLLSDTIRGPEYRFV